MSKYFKRKKFYATEFGQQMKGDKDSSPKKSGGPARKMSEYGKQLKEKQRVRFLYGVSEKQFHNLFQRVSRLPGIRGENFLVALERRLDNVVFRLKLAASRRQCRQMIVHGHVMVNGVRVKSPSYETKIGDKVTISQRSLGKEGFIKQVVETRLNRSIKVPEWLALNKTDKSGEILRLPLRSEIVVPIEEHLIVELYSK